MPRLARATRIAAALILCVGSIGAAWGQETKPPATLTELVEAVVTEHSEGRPLDVLAKANFTPWYVIDELIAKGHAPAARAYAAAVDTPEREALVRFAAHGADAEGHTERRAAVIAAFAALRSDKPDEALDGLAEFEKDAGDLTSYLVMNARGTALWRLGRPDEAIPVHLEAARRAESLGWTFGAIQMGFQAGIAAKQTGSFELGVEIWNDVIRLEEIRGDRGNLGSAYFNRALCERGLENLEAAADSYAKAHALYEEAGRRANAAQTLISQAVVADSLGRSTRSLELNEQAIELCTELGDETLIVYALTNAGHAHRVRSRHAVAREYFERALPLARANVPALVPKLLTGLGQVRSSTGDPERALQRFREVLALPGIEGSPDLHASAWRALGMTQTLLGRFPEAMDSLDRAIELIRPVGSSPVLAAALVNKGSLQVELGAPERARPLYDEALGVARAAGALHEELSALKGIAGLMARAGDSDGAIRAFEEIVTVAEKAGLTFDAASNTMNIGVAYLDRGDAADAREWFERTLAYGEATMEGEFRVQTLTNLALALVGVDELEAAYERTLAAVELAREARLGPGRVAALFIHADVALKLERHEEAIAGVQEGARILRDTLRTLSDEGAARAKERYASLFGIGLEAALRMDRLDQALFFMEESRGLALLSGIESDQALRDAVLPAELRELDERAREEERAARKAFQTARSAGNLGALRAARKRLVSAEQDVDRMVERLQREARAAAAVVDPRTAGVAEIQATLTSTDVFVGFALSHWNVHALVLTSTTIRHVPVGSAESLLAGVSGALTDDAPYVDVDAVAELREALVGGLELPPSTRRVIHSPGPELARLPPALLYPGLEVVQVPSGTVHVALGGGEASEATAVLAIGDPVYAADARRLPPLPGTRAEVKAIGDVTLLGPEATVAKLWDTLASRPRWRSVHFACHGIVDHERPLRSHLALTADADSNGSLPALDVFARRVPADLVVLSACDTARGRTYRAEGVLGLTRAFMLAGTPRIISSLWKVDDAATSALMTRFYEAWSDGRSAASALRVAQEHVRAQSEWSHPQFWAPWVLTGAP